MLSEKIQDALNSQITKELYSAYLYLQMGAWFENANLPGFANWMKVQAQEETSHAIIFFNFVCERGGMVKMGAIEQPPCDYKTALDVFKKVLEHEELVTASINSIMDLSVKEKDYATQRRLAWFIDEQVEEEANAANLIAKLKMIKEGGGLFMVDRELAARTFVMPAPLAGGAT